MNDPDISAAPTSATSESEPAAHLDGPADTSAAEQPTAESSAATASLPDPVPHAGARYAGLRLLMLVAVGGILYLIGMRGWLLAFAAVLVSGIVSLFLFMKQRNDAAVNLEHTVDSWKHRHEHQDAELAQE